MAVEFLEKRVLHSDEVGIALGIPLALEDGGWIIFGSYGTWGDETGLEGIYWTKFDANGQVVDELFKTDMPSDANWYLADVAKIDAGFLLTYDRYAGTSYQIFQQVMAPDGQLIGEPVQVTDRDRETSPTETTVLSNGGWIVAGISSDFVQTNNEQVFQLFDADGEKVGDQIVVASDLRPAIFERDDGGFDIVYSDASSDPDDADLMIRHYAADGTQTGTAERIGSLGISDIRTGNILQLDDGGWLVSATYATEFDTQLVQCRFDEEGHAIGDPVDVPGTNYSSDIYRQNTIKLPDGGWLTVWSQAHAGYSDTKIMMRRFDADGTAVTETERIGQVKGQKILPDVVLLEDGGWIVTWHNNYGRYDHAGAYFQRFTAEGERVENNNAPVALDLDIDVGRGGYHVFDDGQFHFRDFERNDLSAVNITAFSSTGRFEFKGEALEIGQEIQAEDLARLEWRAAGEKIGAQAAWLDFQLTDDGGSTDTDVNTDPSANRVNFNVVGSVLGTQGNDRLHGNAKATALAGYAGNDEVKGSRRDEKIDGGSGSDRLFGNDGDDVINGGTGNDVMYGGKGDDVFIILEGAGSDRIRDFRNADIVDLSDFHELRSFSDIRFRIDYGFREAVIKLNDNQTLTIEAHKVNADDFLFFTDF